LILFDFLPISSIILFRGFHRLCENLSHQKKTISSRVIVFFVYIKFSGKSINEYDFYQRVDLALTGGRI